MAAKKFFVYILISVLITSIIVVLSLFLYFKQPFSANASNDTLTADELVERSVETQEITTNLADDGLIRVKFRIQLDNKDAKEELEKRLFQLENAVIYELAGMTQKDIHGQKGMTLIEESIAQKIDEFLEEGKVVRVFTTQKIIQ